MKGKGKQIFPIKRCLSYIKLSAFYHAIGRTTLDYRIARAWGILRKKL